MKTEGYQLEGIAEVFCFLIHGDAWSTMVRAVQAACWGAAFVIATTAIVAFLIDSNSPPASGVHAHALPESIDLDKLFDEFRIGTDVTANAYRVAATTFESDADLEVLAKVCAAGASFWSGLRPITVQLFVTTMCTSVPRVVELARSFSAADNSLSGAAVEAMLRRVMEIGYGENPTLSIRNIIGAALDGHEAFERHEFLDLGCGRGKVLAVACTQLDRTGGRFSFELCHGVEYVDTRVEFADGVHAVLQQALRNASDPELAERLASVVHIEQGDLRSAELASRLFSRVSVIYMYNTFFGADLDGSISRLIAKHARSRTRIMLHTMHDGVWPSDRFRLLRAFERDELVWTKMFLLEVI
jgi:hypothetical protein